jgi:hypothetical protein
VSVVSRARSLAWLVATIVVFATAPAGAAECFVAPDGNDDHDGTARSAPLGSFSAAFSRLEPGDTLTLLDGTYTRDANGRFRVRCGQKAPNSGEDARITVRADNERRASIKGNGEVDRIQIHDCQYWTVDDLRASSADRQDGSDAVFLIRNSHHIRLRNLLIHDVNRYQNSTGLQVTISHHVVAENIGIYYFHRHGFSAYKSDQITLRRAYIDGRSASDVEDGWDSHHCCTEGGDEVISFYYTSNPTAENVITRDSEALSVISGFDTVLGNPGGRHNELLGSVSLEDLHPSFFQSRVKESSSTSARDLQVKDYLVVGARNEPMVVRDPEMFTFEDATFVDNEVGPVHFLAAPGGKQVIDRYYFPGCEAWTCENELEDLLFLNTSAGGPITQSDPPDPDNLQWYLNHGNAWRASAPSRGFDADEQIGDDSDRYRSSTEIEPPGMGREDGKCLAWIPEYSPLSRAGADTDDIGANLLYRYEDGQLTDQPLWDPQTGEFPCGARIPGSPSDVAGKLCFDVHRRLNLGTDNCPLPYDRLEVDATADTPRGGVPLEVAFDAEAGGGTPPQIRMDLR